MPKDRAAESTPRVCGSASSGAVGLTSKASTPALGTNSCSNSSRFGAISSDAWVTPVMLPPGRLACSKSKFDWVGRRFKNDRNGCGRRFRCERRHSAARCNDCHLPINQFSGQCRQAIVLAISPTVLDREVPALDQTRFTQALPKRCYTKGVGLRRTRTEEAYYRYSRLLCACSERPQSRCCLAQGAQLS